MFKTCDTRIQKWDRNLPGDNGCESVGINSSAVLPVDVASSNVEKLGCDPFSHQMTWASGRGMLRMWEILHWSYVLALNIRGREGTWFRFLVDKDFNLVDLVRL